jgi:hypothetical protein
VIVGAGGASAAKGSSFLGRPWGDYARVVFQNSNLGNVITAAGWQGASPLLYPFKETTLLTDLCDSVEFGSGYKQCLLCRVCKHQRSRHPRVVREDVEQRSGDLDDSFKLRKLG